MLSLSGHKLHAPKGIGILYIRKGTKFSPFMIGGHQEKGRRGGTENVPYIIGLGKACELAKKNMEDENTRVKALRDYLEQKILDRIPNTLVNGDRANRLPNTVSVSFEYVEGESILLLLSDLGICASSGSACTSGSLEPSHVLQGDGGSLHGRSRVDPLQPLYLQYQRGDGLYHRASSADHSKVEGHLSLLEGLSQIPGEKIIIFLESPDPAERSPKLKSPFPGLFIR